METRTIKFDSDEHSAPITRRIISRLMWAAIWLVTILIIAAIYLLSFAILNFVLRRLMVRDFALVISASVPAFFLGIIFVSLKQRIVLMVEQRIAVQLVEDVQMPTDETGKPLDMVGRTIGAYELQEVIGRGGMAEVYQAVGNDSIVAIKVMHPHFRYDEENVTRFQREGEFGLGMIHDNIVAVYEVGEVDQVPYIVMEFVDGEDLRHIMRDTKKYSLNDVILWMNDVCGALDIAHKQGYVHRDIKPSNIMIRPTGDAVLMDFGIAKFKFATTQITAASVGTIDYMAPEQIQNSKNIDHRADIYALGIVIFELVTGLLPYEGSIPQVMYAHINHAPPDPRTFNADIPDHVAEAISKALAKQPSDRFQRAGDFAAALRGDYANITLPAKQEAKQEEKQQ